MAAATHAPIRGFLTFLIGAACLAAPASLLAQAPPAVGPEFRVNSYTTGTQERPAARGLGPPYVFTVAWQSDGQDGDGYGIFAQQYDGLSGAPFGTELRVNTYTTSSQHAVSVEGEGSNLVFAWQSEGQDGDLGGVFAQRWVGTGGPVGGEFRVNTNTTSSQGAPAAAVDADGNFVVVWASLDQDGSGSGIFGQRYANSGAPLGGEFQVNSYTTGFQGHPSVAVDTATSFPTNGVFVVVWEGQGADDQPFGIYAQRYSPDGTPIGGEFHVNSFTTGDQRYPRVNAGTGGFTVVWESDGLDGSGPGVSVRGFSLSTGIPGLSDHRVNTYTTGSQNRPVVHSREWGNQVVTWQSDDNQEPQGGVFGQFSYGLSPIGTELRVNTYTTATQDQPVVTHGGYVLFAWSSQQDPDGSRGIYAQRWNPPWIPVELQGFTVE
jgi:hypothetical protein